MQTMTALGGGLSPAVLTVGKRWGRVVALLKLVGAEAGWIGLALRTAALASIGGLVVVSIAVIVAHLRGADRRCTAAPLTAMVLLTTTALALQAHG
jgi:hypothetical protein